MIHLVRHAEAGARGSHPGSDEERPLSERGRAQAESIARYLADRPITRIVSSPSVRTLQTVYPLAEAVGLPVEPLPELAEGAPPEGVALLMRATSPGTVACSHGDVLSALAGMLSAEGMEADPSVRLAMGSVWAVDLIEGRPVHAGYWEPGP